MKSPVQEQLSLVRKSLRAVFRGVASVPDHLEILRHSLRETRQATAAVDEALIARLQQAIVDPPADMVEWRAGWEAIERRPLPARIRIRALRAWFEALLSHCTGLAGKGKLSDAAITSPGTTVIEVAPGELIDRLTILEIKLERIRDEAKLRNVRKEYALTSDTLAATLPDSKVISELRAQLKTVNAEIWQLEDDIRDHERNRTFGESFIALARSVYRTNDRRAAIKRKINDSLNSAIVEEKSYQAY